MLMRNFTTLFFLIFLLSLTRVLGGCCNDNYWCDGDPIFREQPKVSQAFNSTRVRITWTEDYLHLAKCVDYFYVQFAPSDTYGSPIVDYTFVPVTFERKPSLDDWEEAMEPLVSKYIATFQSEYDKDYIIKVVAVDKGQGWGELEGRAIVEAEPIIFHTGPFMEPLPTPDPLQELEETLRRKYPPSKCSKEQMCSELAYEWTQDLTNHLKRFAMPLHDPEPLDTIDILDEDLEVTKYEEGQLHNLGQFLALEPKVDKLNETLAINVTLLVRLLRTTYHWQRFFSNGILSMYHTCGQALPMAIFDDVDIEDVEEVVAKDCMYQINVQLSLPIRPLSGIGATIESIQLSELKQENFQFDATWFTSHFHNLKSIWEQQKPILQAKMEAVIYDTFTSTIQFNKPGIWLNRKYRLIENQLIAASKGKN